MCAEEVSPAESQATGRIKLSCVLGFLTFGWDDEIPLQCLVGGVEQDGKEYGSIDRHVPISGRHSLTVQSYRPLAPVDHVLCRYRLLQMHHKACCNNVEVIGATRKAYTILPVPATAYTRYCTFHVRHQREGEKGV